MEGTCRGEHAERVHSAVASTSAAKSALIASWRRSSDRYRLDPAESGPPGRLTDAELRQARERAEPLLLAAQSNLDRLYRAVGGIGCCVLLADQAGVPIERRGAPADDETFQSWGLWTGSVWSEESEGTNGIGTCLAEQRALTIHRDQHFYARNTLLSCTTAPLYDHEGNLAGALDVSSCRADLTEGFVDLIALAVKDAARRIEAENFRAAFANARVLLTPAAAQGSCGLLAVDADDLVIGASRAARLTLGMTEAEVRRRPPATDLLREQRNVSERLREAERGAVRRALARADGNISAAALALGISRATLHRKVNRLNVRAPH